MLQTNPAKSTSFVFTLTNRRELSLRLQNSSIGALTMGSTPFPVRMVDLLLPSNKIDFTPMSMRFLVSEDLSEWINVARWMFDITRTNDAHNSQVETGELTVLNSENVPIIRIIYKGCYPVVLGDLQYSLVDDDISLSADLSISYDSYDIEIIATGETIAYGED